MLPGDLDLSREAQIIANKHATTGYDSCGESHIVTITNPDNVAMFAVAIARSDFEQAEVATAIVREPMSLRLNGQTTLQQGLFDDLQ
jgi:hypothetical protein